MNNEVIIKEYLSGKSISALSREYQIPYRHIQKLLCDNNITIRGGRKKKTLTEKQLTLLKERFEAGDTYLQLKELFSLDPQTLTNIVKANGFQRRNNNRINKRIRSDYFSIIDSPEKAYWLGFLFTDGSVDHYRSTGRIRFQLQNADIEILEKYKECLCLDCSIIHDKRDKSQCSSIEFVDEQIFNDLAKYNIIPNKTYMVDHLACNKISEEFIPAYLLGLFDGDGSLSFSNDCSTDVTIHFTSYYESIVKDFQEAVDKLIGKEQHNKNFFTSAWHTQWRGRSQVLKILDILYGNCPIHLARKYNKYMKLKESLS